MRSVDYSLKSELTRKLSYFGNLKTSIQSQTKMNNTTLNTSTNLNSSMNSTLVPILNNVRDKKKNKQNLENRIPSPIKNRLDLIPKNTSEHVETLNKLAEITNPLEDKQTKIVEYDDRVITSNPKVITLIDKLKQLSMMTKPKEPHMANLTVSAKDLKVVISINE